MNCNAVAPAAAGSATRSLRSKAAFWMASLALVSFLALTARPVQAESAGALFKKGASAEARDDFDAAFTYYQKAYAAAPKDLRYKAAYYRVRVPASSLHLVNGRKLASSGDEQGALVEFLRAAEIDPSNEAADQEIKRLHQKQGVEPQLSETSLPVDAEKQEELDTMGAPPALKPISNEPLTLHMTEDAKNIYMAVGKAAGINVLFDPDLQSKRVQVDLNGVNLLDALRIIGTVSNTFWRPVTANTLFVAQNSRAKRTELDEQAVQTFYLVNAWQQNDLTDVNTAIRSVLPNVKAYPVPSQNALIVRGTPDELLLAEKLISDLDKARPEVVVDIAVLEVSKNWERNIGLSWPSSASVTLNTNTSTSSTSSSSSSSTSTSSSSSSTNSLTMYDLSHLKASDFAVSISSATANLLLTDSNTKILQNPRIRCTDQQKSTMKIGERIPIATGSYSTGTAVTTAATSLVNTQFQYIDVGVNIEMTPTVHFDHDVTIKMKIEVSSESGTSTIEGVTEPIIAQKTSEQTIRLREGEASVLSGILNRQDQTSWSGIPGLSAIPGLKYLFGSKDHTITDDEIVFLVIPHIVRTHDLTPDNMRTIDLGVGQQTVDLRHLPVAEKPRPAPAVPVNGNSSLGTVPGRSMETAAPAALAQLRQAAESNGAMNRPTPPPPPAVVTPHPAAAQPEAARPASAPALTLAEQKTPVAVGSTFQVPITLTGGNDIAAVPMQVTYEASRLQLVGVDSGDFLNRNGQSAALIHRDDGPGTITLNVSRGPGAPGVNGDGVVCVLVFKAKSAGTSNVVISRPTALNSAQQQLQVTGNRITVETK